MMKRSIPESATGSTARQSALRAWFGLAVGLGLLWAATYIVLPWGQTLPYIQPIMQAIEESDIDAGTYWYTQSEETALAQMYVRHAIRGVE
jgi:hypothetical protein